MNGAERILCKPLSCVLTRDACAKRHEGANATGKHAEASLRTSRCRGCSVGAAHRADGTPTHWADGTVLETKRPLAGVAASVSASNERRREAAVEGGLVSAKSVAKRYSYKGQELTLVELGALAGCKPTAIRVRLRRHSVEDAVAMGADGQSGAPADPSSPLPVARPTESAGEHPATSLLAGAGYRVASSHRVPAGLAIVVEDAKP